MPNETIIAAALLLLAAGWLYWRKPGTPAAKPASPADRLRAMYAPTFDIKEIPVDVRTLPPAAPHTPSAADAVDALATLRARLNGTGTPPETINEIMDRLAPMILRDANAHP